MVRIRLGRKWVGDLLMRCALPDGRESVLPGTAQQWRDALERLVNETIPPDNVQTLKYSGGVVVQQLTLHLAERTIEVVAKHSRPRGLRRQLAALLLGSRERRGFKLASCLLADGIATARPVAVLESTFPSRCGWLLTEYLPDLVDLDHVGLALLSGVDAQHQRRVRDGIIRAVCELTTALEHAGWQHRDYKASNIMLEHWDGRGVEPRAVLLDLEGLSKSRSTSVSDPGRNRHLVRLAASLMNYQSIRRADYARVLIAHLRASGSSARDWRQPFRTIAVAAAAYNRAAAPRRRHKLAGYSID